jgi:hypothetical protein
MASINVINAKPFFICKGVLYHDNSIKIKFNISR